MKARKKQFVTVLCALLLSAVSAVAQNDGSKSQIVERVIHSKNFEGNKIGVSSDRKLVVYLPAGYDGASKRYPVLYFFPSPMDGSEAYAQSDLRPLRLVLPEYLEDRLRHQPCRRPYRQV